MCALPEVKVSDLEPQLRTAIQTAHATGVASGGTPFLDLAASQTALSDILTAAVAPAFTLWGLSVESVLVESPSLPEDEQKHFDEASSMRVAGHSAIDIVLHGDGHDMTQCFPPPVCMPRLVAQKRNMIPPFTWRASLRPSNSASPLRKSETLLDAAKSMPAPRCGKVLRRSAPSSV